MPDKETLRKDKFSQIAQDILGVVGDISLDEADMGLVTTYAQMAFDRIDQDKRLEWLNESVPDEHRRTVIRLLAVTLVADKISNRTSEYGERLKMTLANLESQGLTLQQLLETRQLETAAIHELISEIDKRLKPNAAEDETLSQP
ncbi:MAG: hypothetical protein A2900_05555 [Candidatus Chisholmbacteria bacterium RIFCSPLOWO2_01_FULL_50_28]|uniref:Uncharacterized protein n=1 Tax=Candidatus Chisholmbacteria bacterium RIFCSPHIGHO2_01_FULL_52_32 TaxID=1797591 RepID=A0A1G1VSD6_9BACT|nr:MAG: hypothetical protein A2786_01190 [Candidatus Chisholmbacteria bacterium RIFCSPHIGHO2_01_FULL_52_32]OGY20510.1 MAG: hypothetical protein A2900_05555 [Candidatus Chisholmbacteria bacterium RIFCSPLOWO2_01_FULL_50_28]